MRASALIIGLLTALTFTLPANANPAVELGNCMTDSMNGKERKQLAKWIYFGMSQHSTIKPHSSVSDSDMNDMDKYIGSLITRLLADDCPTQAKTAYQASGGAAFEIAFRKVGEIAMHELMTEKAVSQSLGGFEKYLDETKMEKVFN